MKPTRAIASPQPLFKSLPAALSVVACLAASGCGGGSDIKLAPVKGVVMLDGQPVADAFVQFSPASGPSSMGYTDATGLFEVMTVDRRGAIAGTHRVKVTTGMPRPATEGDGSSTTEVPLTAKPPIDYVFELPVEVQAGGNSVDLDLAKAKKQRG